MKLLCLDQSTKITGYSVWRGKRLMSHGVINLSKINDKEERIYEMYTSIRELINKEKPDFLVIEDVQFQANQQVYKTLSQLQGLVISIAFDFGCGYLLVEPTVWKSYIGVKSRKRQEQKEETYKIVNKKYHIGDTTDDESDSIGIGMWASNNLVEQKEN